MVLELISVSKSLGNFHLCDVSLKIGDSEYFMILGPSGAGKTILLETIAGIYSPDSGRIILDGRDITKVPARMRGIGMVYQDYMLFPNMNVFKNISFGLRQRKLPDADILDKTKKISDLLGISHLLNRMPDTLSGGEQQRVAIARALVIRPKVLLLDEPLSSLDAITRRNMRTELGKLTSLTGVSIIHITHHSEDLISLGDRCSIMHDGRVIQVGDADDIFQKPSTPFVAVFTGMENIFNGTIKDSDAGKMIFSGNLQIYVVTPLFGDVYFGIRPEDLIFSHEPVISSARNVLPGMVEKIRIMGSWAWIIVNCGILLTGVLTVQSLDILKIKTGDSVYVTFKASAVNVFPSEE